MKLKLNTSVQGLIAIVEYWITKKYFDFVYKKSSLSCWKKSAPAPQPEIKWSVSNEKKSNLESIPPCPLYQVQQQHFKE